MYVIEKDIIEAGFSIGLIINAALFLPQAIRLFIKKRAQDVSLLTFAGFNVIQVFIILHGYVKGDIWLIVGYMLSLITCGTVTFLILFYRIGGWRGKAGSDKESGRRSINGRTAEKYSAD